MTRPQNIPPSEAGAAPEVVAVPRPAGDHTPCCFIVDEDSSIRHFLSLIMQGSGIDSEEFADGASLREAMGRRKADLVFINVPFDISDAVESVRALGRANFTGAVQLMSGRGAAVIDNVKTSGGSPRLRMLNPLKKPFETATIQKIVQELGLGMPAPVAARIFLDDALANNWVEFWYQPRIDLKRKWLIGIEAFARVRHPQYGILLPNAFMPGAPDSSILSLAERAVLDAVRMSAVLVKLGVKVRVSVNMALETLAQLPLQDLLAGRRPDPAAWPGLTVDLKEKSVLRDVPAAAALAKQYEAFNVRLAIDDCGNGYNVLSRAESLPFFELKIDPSIVKDCANKGDRRTICRNVIDLAHQNGAMAAGVGFEKASEVSTLVGLKCDFGQGYLLGQPMPEVRLVSLLRQRAAERRQAHPAPAQPAALSA
ncbi:MAG: EAL domain-containing response regulator [Pseudorhodoplanes sp.]|nr:hypothetical protein [Pseudorhodoplanes sp.]MBW7949133.1 EAL domain-containing response regulator [Pseudorhodoplanes sp.]MCL4711580.1 EAL domain-containing response regulator [Pseudorhodoplanes sp.]